jgi:hypothetical protein
MDLMADQRGDRRRTSGTNSGKGSGKGAAPRSGSKGAAGQARKASSKGGSFGGGRSGRPDARKGDARRDAGQERSDEPRGRRSQRSDRGRDSTDDKRSGGRRREEAPRGLRELPKGPDGWGRLARKGADTARREDGRGEPQEPRHISEPNHESETWQRVDDSRRGSQGVGRRSPRVDIHLTDASLTGLTQAQRDRVSRRLGDAAAAFQDERFDDARKILSPMIERHPSVPELHELQGLAMYRLGRWKPATKELETFSMMTGSTEQHPIMADIARALGRHDDVRRLWEELRHDDPDADVMTEGRIVLAGSHADQGDIAGAVRVLEQGPMKAKKPGEHHLRLWYSLADMYERAGDHPRARRGFERVADADPTFADVADRIRGLN